MYTENPTTESKPKTDKYEAHCRRPGCQCPHTGCFIGWVDYDNHTTRPCAECRPSTFTRWEARETGRASGYPMEALQRIMREGHQPRPPERRY